MKTIVPELLQGQDTPGPQPPKKAARSLLHARKNETSPERGGDIWLYTLSDLLLLLMIFFVLLFGMTLGRQEERDPSLQASVAMAGGREESSPVTPSERPRVPDPASEGTPSPLETDLAGALQEENRQQEVAIERRADSLVLTFPERIVFDPGQAQLKLQAEPVLTKVASFILDHPELNVEVQGHTDNRPIHNRRYPSNWELSVDRATQVAKALISLGVDPGHLSVRGFGEYRALFPNDNDENQLKNRRVEIQFSRASAAP